MRRYRKGQTWRPPTAAEHAAMAESVDGFRKRPSGPNDRELPGDQILVKNESGSNQSVGAVLAVTCGTLLSSIRDYPWSTADVLGSSNTHFPLCVLLEPLPNDAIGPAVASGVAVTSVNVGATTHRFAYPSGAATIVSGTFGPFRILSELTETGTQLVLCLVGQEWPILRGKLDGDLNSGSSATMSVWYGSTLADTTENVTIYDASSLAMITTAKKLASGTAVTAHFVAGKWYLLTAGACEVAQ